MINILVYSLLYAIFNVTGAAIIKSKLLVSGISDFKEFLVFFLDFKIIIAMIFIFISMFFSIKALSLDKFSMVIPILTGVNFVVTIAVGYFFFKDYLVLTGYIGILLIILGIYLLGLGK